MTIILLAATLTIAACFPVGSEWRTTLIIGAITAGMDALVLFFGDL